MKPMENKRWDHKTGRNLLPAILGVFLTLQGALVFFSGASHGALVKPDAPDAIDMGCGSRLVEVQLAGSFALGATGTVGAKEMGIWVGVVPGPAGKPADKTKVVGFVGAKDGSSCEAMCTLVRLEKFLKDKKPSLLELQCEGLALKTLQMPVHIQWEGQWEGEQSPAIRLGSGIFGTEQAKLKLELDTFTVASK